MKKSIKLLSLLTLITIIAISCDNIEKIETDKYVIELEPIEPNEDEENLTEVEEESINNKEFLRGIFGSPVERNWRKIHKQCMAKQKTKRLIFLGVSNKLSLGTIYQNRFISVRDEITSNNFSQTEMESFFKKGSSGSCDFQQQVKVDADALMDVKSESFSNIDNELGIAISNNKEINATIEGFQIHNLYTGRLISLLERTQKQSQLDYFNWFKEKGNLLITSVVEINGFSMTIEIKKNISSSLKAKLDEGLSGKLGETDINVRFKYESETKIKMISETNFFVFGEVVKIKKIMRK